MKRIILTVVTGLLAFWLLRVFLFSAVLDPAAWKQSVTSQRVFVQERDAFVGQQLKFRGMVVDSYYLLGVGYYKLQDSRGDVINILCDHYPPASNQLLEVIVYVSPLLKIDKSLTLQLEVVVPKVLLTSPNSSKI